MLLLLNHRPIYLIFDALDECSNISHMGPSACGGACRPSYTSAPPPPPVRSPFQAFQNTHNCIFCCWSTNHDIGMRQPNDSILTRCLEEMPLLLDQRPIYLIFDALDECSNVPGIPTSRIRVLQLVEELVDLHIPLQPPPSPFQHTHNGQLLVCMLAHIDWHENWHIGINR